MESGPILFYGQHREYPEFSNFYVAPFVIKGKEYATVEHYFQACKATNRQDHEKIRKASTADQAKQLGRQIKLRKDWEQVKTTVMHHALLCKFEQNQGLKQLLLATGDRVLHEDSPPLTPFGVGWEGAGKTCWENCSCKYGPSSGTFIRKER